MPPVKPSFKEPGDSKKDDRWDNLRVAALCIAVADYQNGDQLGNPVRDAQAVYDKINQLPRCRAAMLVNPKNKDEIYEAIRDKFLEPLSRKPPEVVIIYYAGHGVQIGTKLFLIPARARHGDRADCESTCLSHVELFRWLKEILDDKAQTLTYSCGRPPVHFLLGFDMCRDGFDSPAHSFSCDPGLVDAPLHWSMFLSTSRGAVAQDGDKHAHSPFAIELSNDQAGIFAPGVTLKQGIENACKKVFQETQQRPVEIALSRLPSGFCLRESGSAAVSETAADISNTPCGKKRGLEEGDSLGGSSSKMPKDSHSIGSSNAFEKRTLEDADPPTCAFGGSSGGASSKKRKMEGAHGVSGEAPAGGCEHVAAVGAAEHDECQILRQYLCSKGLGNQDDVCKILEKLDGEGIYGLDDLTDAFRENIIDDETIDGWKLKKMPAHKFKKLRKEHIEMGAAGRELMQPTPANEAACPPGQDRRPAATNEESLAYAHVDAQPPAGSARIASASGETIVRAGVERPERRWITMRLRCEDSRPLYRYKDIYGKDIYGVKQADETPFCQANGAILDAEKPPAMRWRLWWGLSNQRSRVESNLPFPFDAKSQRLRGLDRVVRAPAPATKSRQQGLPDLDADVAFCTCKGSARESRASPDPTVRPCSDACKLNRLYGSTLRLNGGSLAVCFSCTFRCGFRGSRVEVEAHEATCRAPRHGSRQVGGVRFFSIFGFQAGEESERDEDAQHDELPMWVYLVRKFASRCEHDRNRHLCSKCNHKDPELPTRPSHVKHACSECHRMLSFSLMQPCCAHAPNGAEKHLCAVHKTSVQTCKLCQKQPRLVCPKLLCSPSCRRRAIRKIEAANSAAGAGRGSISSSQYQPAPKHVQRFVSEEVSLKMSGQALEQLRNRIRKSHEITVFLSSPFQGLLHERAGLVERHGPDLVAICERHGVNLHFVDLRWGITSTMSKEAFLTVRTCLDAISDSDVFIGFYAQRYGASMIDGRSHEWLVKSLELCYESYPWLRGHAPVSSDLVTTTKAVTHLEFEHGYNDEHRAQGEGGGLLPGPLASFAFFRGEEFDEEEARKSEEDAWKYRSENAESRRRLDQLQKDALSWANRGLGAYYTYGTPEDFSETASQQLKDLLENVLEGYSEARDYVQENHLRRLRFAYAGIEEYERRIQAYIESNDRRPLLVTSAPGGGKSALLAKAIELNQENDSCTCIFHFVGVNQTSKELDTLMDGLRRQVEADLPYASVSNSSENDKLDVNKRLGHLAKKWCDNAQGRTKRLVFVIDGLNELADDTGGCTPHDLRWLDGLLDCLGHRVRLIVSTLRKCEQYWSGRCFKVLEDRNSHVLEIDKVSSEQCSAMIQDNLRGSRRQIEGSFNLATELTRHARQANPLFISTFINEMKIFSGYRVAHGVFEQLESFVRELLRAEDIVALLDTVFRRLERVFLLPPLCKPLYLGQLRGWEPVVETPHGEGVRALRRVELKCMHWKCPRSDYHECSIANCHRKDACEDCRLHHVEPGAVIKLPREQRSCIVVKICSECEFEVMDHAQGQPRSDDEGVYLLNSSLVARVLRLVWASKEGLKITEILYMLNAGLSGELKVVAENGRLEQHHLQPVLGGLHRIISKNSGLVNLEHDSVRMAVENRYLAFSSYRRDRPFSGRIRTLLPKQRRVAEERRALLHQGLADYFRVQACRDDNSDLQSKLPRAIREKHFHETRSGEKPSFMVVARVRPYIAREKDEREHKIFVSVERMRMCAVNPVTRQPKVYTMDCCLSEMQDQQDVWRRIEGRNLVEKALDGINVTIMAYGQTGSGKTYTMFGKSGHMHDQVAQLDADGQGIIPTAITELLQGLKRRQENEPGFTSYKLQLSVVEIYNERVRDLRSPGADASSRDKLSLVTSADDWWNCTNSVEISSTREALSEIDAAYKHRVVKPTAMNDMSSRSHCIISVAVEQEFKYDSSSADEASSFGFRLYSRVNLVDLAGSERGRTRKWNVAEEQSEAEVEAIHINKSLLVLNQVISNLSDNKAHAPFRESKLTRLLQNSLGGNAFTVLVVNLSPCASDYGETLSTLEYARRAKRIQNKVTQNAEDMMSPYMSRADGKKSNAVEKDEEAHEEQEAIPDPEHVLVSFEVGDSFDPDSTVTLLPQTVPDEIPEGTVFRAKVIKYNAERKLLTLQPKVKDVEIAKAFVESVVKLGTSISCRKGKSRAIIKETDAEWHRHQSWAIPCPWSDRGVGKKVRWKVEVEGVQKEHEGTIWGWLPADESDYFPDEPEEEGGKPGPLWRVHFRPDINNADLDYNADLDENEITEALKLYSAWSKKQGREMAAAVITKKQAAEEAGTAALRAADPMDTAAVAFAQAAHPVAPTVSCEECKCTEPHTLSSDEALDILACDDRGFEINGVPTKDEVRRALEGNLCAGTRKQLSAVCLWRCNCPEMRGKGNLLYKCEMRGRERATQKGQPVSKVRASIRRRIAKFLKDGLGGGPQSTASLLPQAEVLKAGVTIEEDSGLTPKSRGRTGFKPKKPLNLDFEVKVEGGGRR